MNPDDIALGHHPASQGDRAGLMELAFGLLGGPAAWFVQLCAGFALSSWPCFPAEQHMSFPVRGFDWTWAAAGFVSLAAFVVCLGAMLISLRRLRGTGSELESGHRPVAEARVGRSGFLALWGAVAGGAFAVVTAFTAVSFFILPRCAG